MMASGASIIELLAARPDSGSAISEKAGSGDNAGQNFSHIIKDAAAQTQKKDIPSGNAHGSGRVDSKDGAAEKRADASKHVKTEEKPEPEEKPEKENAGETVQNQNSQKYSAQEPPVRHPNENSAETKASVSGRVIKILKNDFPNEVSAGIKDMAGRLNDTAAKTAGVKGAHSVSAGISALPDKSQTHAAAAVSLLQSQQKQIPVHGQAVQPVVEQLYSGKEKGQQETKASNTTAAANKNASKEHISSVFKMQSMLQDFKNKLQPEEVSRRTAGAAQTAKSSAEPVSLSLHKTAIASARISSFNSMNEQRYFHTADNASLNTSSRQGSGASARSGLIFAGNEAAVSAAAQKEDAQTAFRTQMDTMNGLSALHAGRPQSSPAQHVDQTSALKHAPALVQDDMAALVERVLSTLKYSGSSSESVSTEINLNLQSLGKIRIKLEIDNASVSTNMQVTDYSVKQLIESSLTNLKDALQQHGFSLASFDVNTQDGRGGYASHAGGFNDFKENWRGSNGGASFSGSGREDLMAAVSSEAYMPGRSYINILI